MQTKLAFLIILILFTLSVHAEPVKKVKIGVICTLTGEYALVGQSSCNAIQLAKDEFNEKNKLQVELVIEEDAFKAQKAISAYQKLQPEKLDGLISISSIAINTLRDKFHKLNYPIAQVFISGEAPITDNIFYIVPSPIEPMRGFGKHIKDQGFKQPVLVYTLNDTFIRFAEALTEGLGSNTKTIEITDNNDDFRAHALKALSYKPDVIVFSAVPTHTAMILKNLKKSKAENIKFAFDANFQSGVETFKTILGDLEYLHDSYLQSLSKKVSKDFINNYQKMFNEKPAAYAEFSYDTFYTYLNTYDANPKIWQEKLQKINFDGLTGKIQFDKNGARTAHFEVIEVKDYLTN